MPEIAGRPDPEVPCTALPGFCFESAYTSISAPDFSPSQVDVMGMQWSNEVTAAKQTLYLAKCDAQAGAEARAPKLQIQITDSNARVLRALGER